LRELFAGLLAGIVCLGCFTGIILPVIFLPGRDAGVACRGYVEIIARLFITVYRRFLPETLMVFYYFSRLLPDF